MNDLDKILFLKQQDYLSLNDASLVFGIGKNTLRRLTDEHDIECVLWIGSKRYIRQESLRKILSKTYSIAA